MKYYFKIWQKTYLVFLCLIIFISIFSYSLVTLISQRLQSSMEIKSAEMLGGNKVLYSAEAIDPAILAQANAMGIKYSLATVFLSMISYENEFALAEIKAVDNYYPLAGKLKVSNSIFGSAYPISTGPEPGSVWLVPRLMLNLNLKINDWINIGEAKFQVRKILSYEPDRIGETVLFAAQALINQIDLPATGVLIPGSRIQYKLMLLGSKSALENFESWLRPQLTSTQEIVDIKTARGNLKTILERMQYFLYIFAIVNIFFTVASLFIISGSFIQVHRSTIALLRSLGLRSIQLFNKLFMVILILALAFGILGIVVALIVDNYISYSFHEYLAEITTSERIISVISILLFFIVILCGFLIPTLNTLRSLSPTEVFRKPNNTLKVWYPWTALFTFIMMGLLIIFTIKNIYVGMQLLASAMFVLFLSIFFVWLIIKIIKYLTTIISFPSYFRFSLKTIFYNINIYVLQLSSLALALTFFLVFYLVQSQLLNTWQSQLPLHTPNYFAMNITPREITNFQQFLNNHKILYSTFYPIVRARLLSINNQVVQQNMDYSESQKKNQPTRLLNLTESEILPPDNIVMRGNWFDNIEEMTAISIEEGFANRISATLNDVLAFQIGDQILSGQVKSIRKVAWDNFKPNFYVIFKKGSFENFPTTYLGSFYLEPTKIALLSDMTRQFPSVSIIEIEKLIVEVKALLDTLMKFLNWFLICTFCLGLILFSMIISTQVKQNVKQYHLLKVLGASKNYLFKSKLAEYLILGLTSGTLALFSSSLIYYWISVDLLKIPFKIQSYSLLMGFIIYLFTFALLGFVFQKCFANPRDISS